MLPKDTFDTHTHIFDPDLGPYAAGRAYTPEDAPLKKLIAFNQSLSTDPLDNTLVLVQPSPYENDCTVIIQGLQKLKDQNVNAFGIAVLDLDSTTDAQLKELHALGMRGIRLNFQADGKELSTEKLVAALRRTADRIRYLPGWMIQLFVPGWSWDSELIKSWKLMSTNMANIKIVLHDTITGLPVKIIADHLGGMRGASKLPSDLQSTPASQPGFESLLSLAKQSHVVVKVSGLYRMSSDVPSTYSDLQPILETFAKEIPGQLIWGSDWPHTGEGGSRIERKLEVKEPFRIVDDTAILAKLHNWMGSHVYRKMLVDNPRRLYQN